MKKYLFSLLCLTLIAGAISTSQGYTELELQIANNFAKKGIIIDYSKNPELYRLNENITRSELMAIALKIKGVKLPDEFVCQGKYADVVDNNWICRTVELSLDNQLIRSPSTDRNTARPLDVVTRAEALAILLKANGLTYPKNIARGSYSSNIPQWQIDVMEGSVTLKIIPSTQGRGPNTIIKRKEVLGLAHNMKYATGEYKLSTITTPLALNSAPQENTEAAKKNILNSTITVKQDPVEKLKYTFTVAPKTVQGTIKNINWTVTKMDGSSTTQVSLTKKPPIKEVSCSTNVSLFIGYVPCDICYEDKFIVTKKGGAGWLANDIELKIPWKNQSGSYHEIIYSNEQKKPYIFRIGGIIYDFDSQTPEDLRDTWSYDKNLLWDTFPDHQESTLADKKEVNFYVLKEKYLPNVQGPLISKYDDEGLLTAAQLTYHEFNPQINQEGIEKNRIICVFNKFERVFSVTNSSVQGPSYTHIFTESGKYTIEAKIEDSFGNILTSRMVAEITITGTAPVTPPSTTTTPPPTTTTPPTPGTTVSGEAALTTPPTTGDKVFVKINNVSTTFTVGDSENTLTEVDEAVRTMKIGDKKNVTISSRTGGKITTNTFVVELVDIQRAST